MLAAILVAVFDYRNYEKLAYVMYAGGIAALCLVFVLGADIRGSSRWIQLGSFTFQPSEFMKILVILVVAKYLHDDPKVEPRNLLDLAAPLALTALPVVLVMAQPDLGTSIVYALHARDDQDPAPNDARARRDDGVHFLDRVEGRDARLSEGSDYQLPGPGGRPVRRGLACTAVTNGHRQRGADGGGIHAGHAEPVWVLA